MEQIGGKRAANKVQLSEQLKLLIKQANESSCFDLAFDLSVALADHNIRSANQFVGDPAAVQARGQVLPFKRVADRP